MLRYGYCYEELKRCNRCCEWIEYYPVYSKGNWYHRSCYRFLILVGHV